MNRGAAPGADRAPYRVDAGQPNVAASDERRLIDQARGGDAAAFEDLVRRYDRDVLRLALRIVRSEDEARDIYQEAFLRVFRTLHEFRHECAFKTFLYRVVTNLCLDHLRRASVRHEEPSGPAPGGNGESRDDVLERAPDTRPDHDPERHLERREIRGRVEAALGRLAPRERLVFEMRHEQGLRTRAIAEALETSDETVRNCLYRAHRALREALADLTVAGRSALGRVDQARAE